MFFQYSLDNLINLEEFFYLFKKKNLDHSLVALVDYIEVVSADNDLGWAEEKVAAFADLLALLF